MAAARYWLDGPEDDLEELAGDIADGLPLLRHKGVAVQGEAGGAHGVGVLRRGAGGAAVAAGGDDLAVGVDVAEVDQELPNITT